jgi:hypothetical protein
MRAQRRDGSSIGSKIQAETLPKIADARTAPQASYLATVQDRLPGFMRHGMSRQRVLHFHCVSNKRKEPRTRGGVGLS